MNNHSFFSLLRLESRFPRPLGDSANPQSHDFPVKVCIIQNATVKSVVYENSVGLLESFVNVAQEQIASGAAIVGTSCGFMAEHQAYIESRLSVPFLSSALLHLPHLLKKFTGEPVGVITFDADVLESSGWWQKVSAPQVIVAGLPKSGHLYQVIRNDEMQLDVKSAEADVEFSIDRLFMQCLLKFNRKPSVILFECTNLGPYKEAMRRKFACPIFDYNDVMAQAWTTHFIETLQ
jgi:hypothetical protein